MAIAKYASLEIIDARLARRGHGLVKDAHRHEFDYTPRPGFLYVRSRAISSRCNDNYDEFPAEEIKKAYRSFIGKPVFVNHHNDNHRRARGVIVDAALHEDTNPDGSPDTWTEVLMEVDAVRFPKLAQAIIAGHIARTSMGTDVEHSLCSFCGNKARTPLEYCRHIPAMKGQRIERTTASGEREAVLVAEICYGLGFFENSLLVEPPADPTAWTLGVDARGLEVAASVRPSTAPMPVIPRRMPRQPVTSGLPRTASRSATFDQQTAPPEVDTLRDETCPVCGEIDTYSGDRCMVCGYLKPPDDWLDPDTQVAKDQDLRQDREEGKGKGKGKGKKKSAAEPFPPEQTPGARPFPPRLESADAEPFPSSADGSSNEEQEGEADDKKRSGDTKESQRQSAKGIEGTGVGAMSKDNPSPRASLLAALAGQQALIERQGQRIVALRDGLRFVCQVAGIDGHPKVAALLKRADDENPAQPVPEPAGEAPVEGTDTALGDVQRDQPAGGSQTDNLFDPGLASETDTSADATTQPDAVETVLDVPPVLENQEVTAPVAGTEEKRPSSETVVETDVRVDDGVRTEEAFPLEGEFATPGSTYKANRTYSALRLARLRIAAGIAEGVTDDITLAQQIEASTASDEGIQTEIDTLSSVQKAAATRNNGGGGGDQARVARASLVPRVASGERTVPSMQGVQPAQPVTATTATDPSDDAALFE